uniref:Uncharacterized protein n=1 Tax=Lotharella globosa TaxID=91324 RepID=A0A7S3Z6F9_9EUKA
MKKIKNKKKNKATKNQTFETYFFKNKIFRYILTPKLFNFKIIGSMITRKDFSSKLLKNNYYVEMSISEILKTFDNYYRIYKLKLSELKYNQFHTNFEVWLF